MKNSVLGAVYLSLAASIWGGMYVVSKYVLNYIPPMTLVWLRYVIAFTCLFTILKIIQYRGKSREHLRKEDWLLVSWIGFIGYFVSISMQFVGTYLSNAHTGALITSATPAFMVLFARIILNERLTIRKFLSLLVATIGVIIVIGWEVNIGSYFWGSIILIGAALTWALLSVYVKLASKRLSILTITTYAILVAILLTTPLMLWELQRHVVAFNSSLVIWSVLYLGIVSTAVAFFLWNRGLELMDTGVGSLFFFFQPLVGSLLGWLLLHEQIKYNFFMGGILILAGVSIVAAKKEI